MTPFVLIRHAATAWNQEGLIQGQSDPPLSPEGRRQVGRWRLPAELRGYRWLVSPLARARETAALLGLEAPEPEPALAEMDWGEWEGQSLAELRRRFGAEMAAREALGLDFQPPGGESPRLLQARLQPLLTRVGAARQATAAVSHRGVIRALYALASGWDMTGKPLVRFQDACAQEFLLDATGRPQLGRLNRSLTDAP